MQWGEVPLFLPVEAREQFDSQLFNPTTLTASLIPGFNHLSGMIKKSWGLLSGLIHFRRLRAPGTPQGSVGGCQFPPVTGRVFKKTTRTTRDELSIRGGRLTHGLSAGSL